MISTYGCIGEIGKWRCRLSTGASTLFFLAALLFSLAALSGCQNASDKSFGKLLGEPESQNPNFGNVGNAAISFNPVTLDFGIVRINVRSAISALQLKNISSTPVFIQSIGNQTNIHYGISSSTCPTAPSPFGAGATCTVNLYFEPKATGTQQWSFGVVFGKSADDSQFQGFTGIKGLGATSVNFPGLDSIDQVRAASVRLNWTDVPGENGFLVFKQNLATQALEYIGSAPPLSTNFAVSGLTPNTLYKFRVQAVDLFGQPDANTKLVSVTTALAPVLTAQADLFMTNIAGEMVVGQTYNFDFNNVTAGAPGNDNYMTYTCFYDTTIDGLVAPTLPCSTLPGVTMDPSFATNGRFSWTPVNDTQSGKAFEILVRGNDGSLSADRIFGVNIRDAYVRSNLLFELSANFVNSGKPGKNSPLTSTWENLYYFGGTSLNATLTGTFMTGWAGDGTDFTNPYRLVFDGGTGASSSRASLTNPVAIGANFGFTTWIKPANTALGSDAYVFADGGVTAPGWSVRQTAAGLFSFDLGDSPGYEATVLSQTPYLFYKLDEGSGTAIADATGNGHTGTLTNPASATYGVIGHDGNALTFASTAYVQVGPIAFNGANPTYSVSAWVKTPLATSGNWKTVTRANGTTDHHIIFQQTTNEFGSYLASAGGFVGSGVFANSLTPDWHLFTVTSSNAGTKYYVDGAPAGTSAYYSSSDIYAIGNYQSSAQPAGSVDGVAIWLRQLSAAEVLAQFTGICKVALQQGTWTMLSGTYNGTSTDLYKNGNKVCSASPHSPVPNTTQTPSLGANTDGTAGWPGQIADFRIHSTMSAADVATDFNATKNRYLGPPYNIPNMQVWVDAKDPNFTGTAPADGSAIPTWKDMAGGALDLSANGTTPTYDANGLATGYPAIYYGGAGSHTSGYTVNGAYTVALVSRLQGTQNARVMGDWSGQNMVLGYWSGKMHGFYINGAPENLFSNTTPLAIAATTQKNAYIFSRAGTGGAFSFYNQGALYATNASSNSAAMKIVLGCGNGALGECSKAYVSEMIIFSRALSTSELSTLWTYLQTKWGF